MPFPVSMMPSTLPSSDSAPTLVENITDPAERQKAIERNRILARAQELEDLAQKCKKEYNEAFAQYKVLKDLGTLTPEEHELNHKLTKEKETKAFIALKMSRQVRWDAELEISRLDEK
ncbi:hypothetical protein CRE_00072 [Caenorhabditis remanei]|uniref:Uncharacterized protein n=2 Tax=Caenorhabditis remanei TaxID=31234 RepID=E3LCY4_CAERE|nr:hypothetical protein CRE_00072 [Caenorhabditis remanei]